MRRAYLGCFLSPSVDVFGGQTLVSRFIVPFFEKKRFSRIFSNMKAYVIVRGSVANIRNIVDEKGPEVIYFQCSK